MSKNKIKSSLAISDSGFIFMPNTGDSFSVNPVGLEILNMIKQGKTDKDIRTHILAEYQVDSSTFEKDFYDFVSQLKQNNLIESAEEKK